MDRPIEIDLCSILRERLPGKRGKLIPRFLISGLEKLIHQDELNEMLRIAFPLRGSAFAGKILDHLGITVKVKGLEDLGSRSRLMFASNHPLGGLDGIALIAVLGERYGDGGVRFIVNDMLMNIEPLSDMFLPVNKYGSQGREAARRIGEALDSDVHILQFPAGLVSRLQPDGSVADLDWQKSFVAKAIGSRRDIVPVRFEGLNSMRFYRMARWRKRLGLKFNIEQTLLPGEVFRSSGKRFGITFGSPVSWEKLRDRSESPVALAAAMRRIVYSLR